MVVSLRTSSTYDGTFTSFKTFRDGQVESEISTPHLELRSVTRADTEHYVTLLQDPEVAKTFMSGEVHTRQETENLIARWLQRWKAGNPLSAFSIFLKDSKEFVGQCITAGDASSRVCEIGYLIRQVHWGKGYGKEAVQAVVHSYFPLLRSIRCLTGNVTYKLLQATSRVDNRASCKILQGAGLQAVKREEKFGALRDHFEKRISIRPVDLILTMCAASTDFQKQEIEETLEKLFMVPFLLFVQTVAVPVATMREKPENNATVASQAIFSETVQLLEEQGEWVKIETVADHYQGWTKKEALSAPEAYNPHVVVTRKAAHLYNVLDTELGPILTLPFESRLEVVEEPPQGDRRWLKVKLPDATFGYIQRGDTAPQLKKLNREEVCDFSMRFLDLPYTWGGKSSFGYDCSGFVQMLYRQMGISLPRDSKDQIHWEGFCPVEIENLKRGDLIFWGKSEQKINHVGMYLGDGKFIHTIASVEKMPYLRVSRLTDSFWDAKPTNYHAYRTARTLKQ